MLKKIGLGLALVLAVLLIVIATRPDTFRIERSTAIQAPAEIVFGNLNDFHKWSQWSPWEKMDPKMEKTYEGAAAGEGAITKWTGPQAGSGQMTLTASKPFERVEIKLDFFKPFEAHNTVDFALKPATEGVTVTWAMSGKNNFMGKAFSLFMNMDAMVGKDFEKGLADLKQVSETEAKKKAEEAKNAAAAAPVENAPVTQ